MSVKPNMASIQKFKPRAWRAVSAIVGLEAAPVAEFAIGPHRI